MDLAADVSSVKGVGEKTSRVLCAAGIRTVKDLLYNLPRDYENYQAAVKIRELRPGKVMVRGKIEQLEAKQARRRNFVVTTGVVRDETGAVGVVWFNQPYRARQFDAAREYYFTGELKLQQGRYQLVAPSAVLAGEVEKTGKKLVPIYRARGELKTGDFRRLMENLRPEFVKIPDLLPAGLEDGSEAENAGMAGARAEALFMAHFPEVEEEIKQGRAYLAYEELFGMLLAAQLSKRENARLKALSLPFRAEKTLELVKSLPFCLTDGQRRAAWEILRDLEREEPMNRLLQGDVGSGKTVVAALAIAQAVAAGGQVALLAPTALLAIQHSMSLTKILAPLGIRVALLIGATPVRAKKELKKRLKNGEIDVAVGTHALITDDTEFSNLVFCVIDEQHRFGVEQRRKLLLKTRGEKKRNLAPHLLMMTATPIPRSLQLTVLGELEVSVIRELPKGRKQIITKVLTEIEQSEKLYSKIRAELTAGRQIYWVCAQIGEEQAEKSEIRTVRKQLKILEKAFPDAKIGMLHGKMKSEEKEMVMADFLAGKIEILVSTTVVEVGVDVPNASVMVVMDADGFGLAQLHQLRGRVGRGEAQGYCYLVTSDSEQPPSRRLKEMEKSTDGFYLAEVDLALRGPGEIYGALQHGALDLKIASITDMPIIARAARDAKRFLDQNPEFVQNGKSEYRELWDEVKHYQMITRLN